jgi:lipopolysaccharide export system permease protein
MKKLIFINFLKDTLKFFFFFFCSLSLIVWVIQAVNFLDFVTEDGHSLYVYFLYTLHNLPKIIHRVLPFVFFISLFYQINKYELNNELFIFWTIGISKLNFVKVILSFSLFFLILQIILGAYIVPISQDKARSYIRNSNIDFFPSLLQEGKFIDTVKNLTVFIMIEESPGKYNNIFLKELYGGVNTINLEESKIVYAKKGSLKINNNRRFLELTDGTIMNKDGSKINNFSFKKIDFDLMQYDSKSTSIPKIQELGSHLLIKCLIYNSKNIGAKLNTKNFTCNEKISKEIKQEFLKRFYKPIYLLLLALLACLIIFSSKENNKFLYHKTILFVLAISVIVISEVSLRYISQNNFGTYFFVSFPLLSFLIIYAYLIKRLMQRGK